MVIKVCPECESENIYFSPKRTVYVCEDCESEFIKPAEKKYCPTKEDYSTGFDGEKIAAAISHLPPVDTRLVKVFLASSTADSVKDKREIISAAVCTANGRDESLYIDLYHCEDDDRSKRGRTQQEEYNEKIRECDVFVLLSENSELGGITLNEEVRLAAAQKRERGIKLFVFGDKSSPADTERGANWRRFKNEYLPLFEPIFSYKDGASLEEKAKKFIGEIKSDDSIGTVCEGCFRLGYNIELIGSDNSARRYLYAIADRLNTLNNRFIERNVYQSLMFKVNICCDESVSGISPLSDNYFVIPCDEKSCSESCKGKVFAKIEECFRTAKNKTDVSLFRGEDESGSVYLPEHEKRLFDIMDSNYSYSFSHKDTVVNKPTMNERLSDIREAYAYFEEGLYFYNQKNYYEAERRLLMGAEFGFPMACFYIGFIYGKIDGFIDMAKAEKYTLLAAEEGIAQAMYNIGGIYVRKLQKEKEPAKNKELIRKAEKYCKAAGKAGIIQAYFNLGVMYTLIGRKNDAVRVFKTASGMGEKRSQFNLAILYKEMGRINEAEHYYTLAAEAGYEEAVVNLSNLYRELGRMDDALKLLLRASDSGQPMAMCQLGHMLLKNGNINEAEKYFKRSADMGNAAAIDFLSSIYMQRGDLNKARKLYAAAAGKGDPFAQLRFGALTSAIGELEIAEHYLLNAYSDTSVIRDALRSDCESELGLLYERKKQLDKAEEYYRRSADSGNTLGEYNLAHFLWKYYDFKKLDEAEKYYRRAAKKGDEDAQRELEDLLILRGKI